LFDDVVFEEACGFKASLASPDDITALKEALASERATALDIAAELAVARAKASEDSALIPSRSCGSPSWSARSMGKDRKVVIDPPTACECCGGNRLRKLSEDVTRTLESSPRRWKVIETVREKFSCRDCEKISQAPAPFHAVARGWAGPSLLAGWAGPSLLAMIIFEKFGQHQPLDPSGRAVRSGRGADCALDHGRRGGIGLRGARSSASPGRSPRHGGRAASWG
jgi:transposase